MYINKQCFIVIKPLSLNKQTNKLANLAMKEVKVLLGLVKAMCKQEAMISLNPKSVYFWADLLTSICNGNGRYIDK